MHRTALGAILCPIVILVIWSHPVAAQSPCPFRDNDSCDHWRFEQADKQLTDVVAAALARIDEFAHADTRQEAKDRLMEAHRNWILLRASDCQAESAFQWLRSARTREGNLASCLHALTLERIGELKRRYLLNY